MMKTTLRNLADCLLLCALCLSSVALSAQTVPEKIRKAYRQFESDSQLRHAISSLYIVNSKTGEVVFEKNSQVGLAPASTQKIITAAAAFELLGKDYRYKTELAYDGKITNGDLKGNLYIMGNGDPTFGSWRYGGTSETAIFERFRAALEAKNIKRIEGFMIPLAQSWETQLTPDGWIWQDIGNYYGAGASAVNWRENQFDVRLKSSQTIGSPVSIVATTPDLFAVTLVSEVKSASKNSGDNAYIYLPPFSSNGFIRGTIPVGEDSFKISGAIPNPAQQFVYSFLGSLSKKIRGPVFTMQPVDEISGRLTPDFISHEAVDPRSVRSIYTHYSPRVDSIIYWFLQKSINLYGEALIKTLGLEKKGFGATDTGVVTVKDFWKQKGIDPTELNIKDGSGLSPQNRVTTHAQVEILQYAKKQAWFPFFLNALPEYNNMKMKSGSISDVKGYCGYHTSADGTEYCFSFLVNNFNGSSSELVSKMYRILDVLK